MEFLTASTTDTTMESMPPSYYCSGTLPLMILRFLTVDLASALMKKSGSTKVIFRVSQAYIDDIIGSLLTSQKLKLTR
ncbi:hypothetical protein FGO68_gene285 [Halteria grandinella]|uniref:Uncharacterized protein n=1 Tax=Halteria grandinella TaxID=5974 RepID=A0A8J8NWU7_HALGN|nr:hypothetical protein FGO68_gene285 [Halteria grandinella]